MKLGGSIPTMRHMYKGMPYSLSANGQLIGGSAAIRTAWNKDRNEVLSHSTKVKSSKSSKSSSSSVISSSPKKTTKKTERTRISSKHSHKVSKTLLSKITSLEKVLTRANIHLASVKAAIQ